LNETLPLGDIRSLLGHYEEGRLTPSLVVETVHGAIQSDPDNIWISRLSLESLRSHARRVEALGMHALPLYGIPFAIKDNIDLAGVPTTAGCPAFSYTPAHSATVVRKLLGAGAIPIGKTNLDQFATGLNGTRSPYGPCRNAFNPEYISGGSSSGSAVALAKGYVCFSLGTDTAGSGRVPAAFNNLIGFKPTRGRLSTRGTVPACRSLDCISIFAFTARDAACISGLAAGYDPEDIYSREPEPHAFDFDVRDFCFGVPCREQLRFFGNHEGDRLFDSAIALLQSLGGQPVEIDFSPFLEAAHLLYGGPWIAERYAAVRQFFDSHSDKVIEPVRELIAGAREYSAADAFEGHYRLRKLKREIGAEWKKMDCLLTPTAGTIYRIEEMQRDPIRLNANLGYYTNFMNLLNYAAVAVPAGFRADGLPFGVTISATAHLDAALLRLAARMQASLDLSLGATGISLPPSEEPSSESAFQTRPQAQLEKQVRVAVCGAHLSGLPLNPRLTQRRGRLVELTTTSPDYRLYALPGGPPYRPGMVRVQRDGQGEAIEVEVWELPVGEFGSFVAEIPAPLGIGTIRLKDGEAVQGFVCEGYALAEARDISEFGGWREYLAHLAKIQPA
jgi:allophanate hydrolase